MFSAVGGTAEAVPFQSMLRNSLSTLSAVGGTAEAVPFQSDFA